MTKPEWRGRPAPYAGRPGVSVSSARWRDQRGLLQSAIAIGLSVVNRSRSSAGMLRGWRPRLLLGLLVVVASIAVLAQAASADVTMIDFNPAGQGLRSDLPNLKPPGFLQFDTSVSGQVYGQPLVVGNTVIVATENDMVYGINKTTGAVSWQHSVGTAEPSTVIGCGDINPSYGVSSTPVIDPASGIVYLTARTWDGSNPTSATWRVFAFNATSGTLQPGWPITIGGTASNDPGSPFDPTVENQRTGLLLLQGRVFFGFGSMCDLGGYKGWIADISTGTGALSLWTAETGSNVEGGVWQAGGRLASDGTSIFASTGNGSFPTPGPGTTSQGALGESTLRLTVDSNGNLQEADRFTPYNAASLSNADLDLGSGGPVLLPTDFGNVPNHPNLLVQPSKTSLYLLDADDLGGMAGPQGPDNVVSELPQQSDWGHAAVWPGDGGYFYLNDVTPSPTETAGPLTAYQVTPTGQLKVAGTSKEQFAWPSGPPVITSNGTTSGSATLWAIDRNGFLRAYNPVPVNGTLQLLWSAPLDGSPTKFSVPAADGTNIFVGTSGHLLAFSAAGNGGEAIEQKYLSVGAASSFLGPAVGSIYQVGVGLAQNHVGGVIYWSQATGAWAVHGAILADYQQLGGPVGFLGFPITDETGTPDGIGRYNHFQHGSIYWTPTTGAHEVHGAIAAKWAALGWERSVLGYPITDETGTPDGIGRFNHFQHGSIYWTPTTGAHEVHGAIAAKWAALGWERSVLGYPITDEFTPTPGFRQSDFQHGSINWNPVTGVTLNGY
jgi:hypothetical protein